MTQGTLARRLAAMTLAFVCAWISGLTSAQAETETWKIRSSHPYTVELEFFSADRNRVWPGNGQVYLLDDSAQHTYALQCQPGERICWGAWDSGRGSPTWGVGKSIRNGCQKCCWTCGRKGEPRSINLR